MKQYVITISRQFGSMGRSIAQALAQQLNIDFYDRDIVEETARRMIREVDRARELYHRRYCPEVKDVFTDHDLMLDSSRFGVEGSARLLAHIAQTLFET